MKKNWTLDSFLVQKIDSDQLILLAVKASTGRLGQDSQYPYSRDLVSPPAEK